MASQLYYMELKGEPIRRVWAYRKAAWAIEDREQDSELLYQAMGLKALEGIQNLGPRLAEVAEALIQRRAQAPSRRSAGEPLRNKRETRQG